jgi:3D (Asp-Asp-Asp) domain-containing protein
MSKDTILGFFFMVIFIAVTTILMVAITPSAEAQIIITDVPQGERVVAVVTAYTASADETDSTPELTAAGTRTRLGIAACPKRHAFGTRIVIEGQEYICEDRMASKFSERFDILVATKAEAFEFGKKRIGVTIINGI